MNPLLEDMQSMYDRVERIEDLASPATAYLLSDMRSIYKRVEELQGQRDELLKTCKVQHEAIDRLLAMIVKSTDGF